MKTMILFLKRIALGCTLSLVVNAVVAQEVQIQHEVQRGETLESIAKHYGVTVKMIKDANPKMGDFAFTGMKLNIPNAKSGNLKDEKQETTQMTLDANNLKWDEEKKITFEPSHINRDENYWFVYGGLSLNSYVGKNADNFKNVVGWHAGITRRSFFFERAFYDIGLGLSTRGYEDKTIESSGEYWDDEGPNYDYLINKTLRSVNLDLPLFVGYEFQLSKISFLIKGGAYFSYALSGELKTEGSLTDYEDIHSSSTEHINESKDIDDMKDFKRFSIGGQLGLEVKWNDYFLGFVYQRGLTSVDKNLKLYEQNLMFSLGLIF